MELSTSRKLLSVIFSIIIALSVCTATAALTATQTLTKDSFLIKHAVSDELVAQCEEQLSAKYKMLETETGIPQNVFETVKKEYPVSASLKTAFQNVFSNESPELYSRDLVDYFERLCTDYLDGNKIKYDKKNVKNAAEEAASIFSETVGLHNMGSASDKIEEFKGLCTLVSAVSVIAATLSTTMLFLIYSNKKKPQIYILSGASGGTAGAALSALICYFKSPVRSVGVEPAVYKSLFTVSLTRYFMVLFAVSALLTVTLWLTDFFIYKSQHSKDK
ncbi:MAG: hypothetical protein K6C14_07550 [Eubacterium sp.]|nr:hypothetical protein [Eubacterium sp.]